MILSITFQFELFLTAIFLGIFLGICYDFLRISRQYFVRNNFFIGLEDLIYWSFMSVVIFLVVLYQNSGEIRLFFIFSIFLGMIIYRLIISDKFINIANKIIKFIIKIFKILFIPIKTFLKILFMPIKIIFIKFCQKIKHKIKPKNQKID